jgi:hypothetical protein
MNRLMMPALNQMWSKGVRFDWPHLFSAMRRLPLSPINQRCRIFVHCTQRKKIGYPPKLFPGHKPAYLTLPPKKSHGLEGDDTEDKDGKKKTK